MPHLLEAAGRGRRGVTPGVDRPTRRFVSSLGLTRAGLSTFDKQLRQHDPTRRPALRRHQGLDSTPRPSREYLQLSILGVRVTREIAECATPHSSRHGSFHYSNTLAHLQGRVGDGARRREPASMQNVFDTTLEQDRATHEVIRPSARRVGAHRLAAADRNAGAGGARTRTATGGQTPMSCASRACGLLQGDLPAPSACPAPKGGSTSRASPSASARRHRNAASAPSRTWDEDQREVVGKLSRR